MDVWLLATVAERLAARGWRSLRFDFRRDVGDPSAAVADLAGAVDAVHVAHLPLALVGWSFGALVGLLHGPHDPRVTHWVGIAPPTAPMEGLPMPAVPARVGSWPARRVVIVGQHEQFFPDPAPAQPHEVKVVAGADHFFFDRDDEVADLVAACLP